MANYDSNGNLILPSVQKSKEEITRDLQGNEPSKFYRDTIEIARGIPRGAVKGIKETAKLIPLAVQYAPFVALPAEYAARKVGGFFGDDDQDDNYSFSTEVGDYQKIVDKWGDFSKMEDMREGIDSLAQPFMDALEQQYKSSLGEYSELFGEFASPFAPLRFAQKGLSLARLKNLKPKIEESKKKLLNELEQQGGKKFDESSISSPYKMYKTAKDKGIKLSDDAEREFDFLTKNRNVVSRLEESNKQMFKAKNLLTRDAAAAASAAGGVMIIENTTSEDTSSWLAPLVGIGAAIVAPPVLIGHGRAGFYNLLGMYNEKILRDEDTALDMYIRARGIEAEDLRDAKGNILTDPDEIKAKKQQIFATSPQELKFYRQLGDQINKLPKEERAEIMASLDTFNQVFEKYRSIALKKGRKDLADAFVPLVGNVVQMTAVRSLHKSLIRNMDSGFFINPSKRLFRAKLGNEIDDMTESLAKQTELVRLEFESLKKLNPEDNLADIIMNDFQTIIRDTDDYLLGMKGRTGEGNSNILNKLKLSTEGKVDLEFQNKAIDSANILYKRYGITTKDIRADYNETNANLVYTAFNNAQQKVNDAYEKAYKDSNGNYVIVKSKEPINKLKAALDERLDLTALDEKGKPAISQLRVFQKELQTQYLKSAIQEQGSQFSGMTDDIAKYYGKAEQAYIESTARQQTAAQARVIFRKDSGMQQYAKKVKAVVNDPTNNAKIESLAKFIDDRFISNRTMNALNDPDLQVSTNAFNPDEWISGIRRRNTGASLRLVDVQRLRSQYMKQAMESKSASKRINAGEVVDILDSFFDDIEGQADLGMFRSKLIKANQIYKDNMLPFKAQKFQEARRNHLTAMSMEKDYKTAKDFYRKTRDPSKLQEISDRVAKQGLGGDDLMRALIDPANLRKAGVTDSPARVLQSMLNNVDGNQKKLLKRNIMLSISRAMKEGESGSGFSFANQLDDNQFIDQLKNNNLISKKDYDNLNDIVTYNKRATEKISAVSTGSLKRAEEALRTLDAKYGRSVENNLIRSVFNAADQPDGPDKILQIANALSNRSDSNLKGFKTFAADLSKDDLQNIDLIENTLKRSGDQAYVDEIREYIRGEGTDESAIERAVKYYKKLGKEGKPVLNAMNDVFIEALIKNAFKNTDRMSSLTSYSTISSRGRKQALNYQQNIVPEALEEAAFNYMPYIEAIGGKKQAKKVRELLEVKRLVVQKPFDKDTPMTGGSPTVMSVESGISRLYSVVRGVVSARYVLTELGVRSFRLGQAEVLKKFLTDPTAIDTLHDVVVKGKNDPYHQRKLFEQIFSTPTMAVIATRAEQITGADRFAPDPITVKVKTQDEDDPFSEKTEKFQIPSSFLESLENSFKGL